MRVREKSRSGRGKRRRPREDGNQRDVESAIDRDDDGGGSQRGARGRHRKLEGALPQIVGRILPNVLAGNRECGYRFLQYNF